MIIFIMFFISNCYVENSSTVCRNYILNFIFAFYLFSSMVFFFICTLFSLSFSIAFVIINLINWIWIPIWCSLPERMKKWPICFKHCSDIKIKYFLIESVFLSRVIEFCMRKNGKGKKRETVCNLIISKMIFGCLNP